MQEIILFIQHHVLLVAAMIATLVILMILEFINQKRSASQVSPAKATFLINREDAVVIDVRSSTLFADGHIIGAQSIPLAELEEKSKKKLDKYKSKPLIITCMTGLDSAKAALLLISQGFDARILTGGIRAWREAGMPIVKD